MRFDHAIAWWVAEEAADSCIRDRGPRWPDGVLAADAITLGCTAIVPDADTTVVTLRRLGLDAPTVEDRCRLAGIDRVACP